MYKVLLPPRANRAAIIGKISREGRRSRRDLLNVRGCATDYLLRSLHVSICDARRAASCADAAASRSDGCA